MPLRPQFRVIEGALRVAELNNPTHGFQRGTKRKELRTLVLQDSPVASRVIGGRGWPVAPLSRTAADSCVVAG